MLLFYICHGHPTYNPDCLTEEGFREAEATAVKEAFTKPSDQTMTA